MGYNSGKTLELGGARQEMNSGVKLIMTMEFVALTRSRMSSWTFRGWGHMEKADEWENMMAAKEVWLVRTAFWVQ